MRVLVVVAVLAACDSGPNCKDAVMRAATRFGNSAVPEVSTVIGECERTAWPKDRRACVADATTEDALVACMAATDVRVPPPVLEPSATTKQLAASAPIKALVFFEPTDELGLVVAGYFKAAKIAVELHDRVKEAGLSTRYKVTHDHTVVLVHDTRSESIELAADLARARKSRELRRFDRQVAQALSKLARPVRVAYLVAGHGELSDRASLPKALLPLVPERKTTMLVKRIAELAFEVKPLAPDALAADVPADATVVMLLAPAVALSAGEAAALQRYLDRGGALLVALDPTAPVGLDHLETTLGVHFDRGHLTDDKVFLPQRNSLADHRFVVTNSFSAHPSVTSLSRTNKGLLLIDSGTLEAAPNSPAKVVFTIKSQDSSFVDRNDNFALDGTEKRGQYNVAAAVEGPKFRAVVFADVDLFGDVLVTSETGRPQVVMMSGSLIDDTLRWLAGEEVFAGEVVAEAGDSSSPESKPELEAELELTKRRVLRALARTIASKHPDDAAREVRHLQDEQAELQQQLDKAH